MDGVESSLCVDTTRVYATGISSGAAMSVSLACNMPDRITAIGPVSGLYYFDACTKQRPIPIIEFHGDADSVVPFHGGRVGGLPSPDVPQAMAAWAKGDGCDPTPKTEQVTAHVQLQAYSACDDGVAAQLYVVQGGGHTWPGARATVAFLGPTTREVSATDLIWNFFASQPPLSAPPTTAAP